MRLEKLSSMKGGWFIGDFEPTLLRTGQFEVAVKEYSAGQHEKSHLHKVATEYTLIVSGKVRMNGKEYGEGDIIIIEPGEATDFLAVTDAKTAVVKVPSVKGDKYDA